MTRIAPLLVLFLLLPLPAIASPTLEQLLERIEAQDARIAQLEEQLKAKSIERASENSEVMDRSARPARDGSKVNVGYKKGFIIEDKSGQDSFKLKMNSRLQFRYTGFSRRGRDYTLPSGKTGTQAQLNDFEMERGRLEFSGHMIDPALEFYLNLDFDTDDNHNAKAHDFWFNYNFADDFALYAGKAFVPGSREWLDGSTTTHLADRSMATSFFRPDRSLGIWAIGEAIPGLNYRAMLANGFKTTDLEREDMDNKLTYALSLWGDVTGDYGKGRADLEHHDKLAVRTGSSFTYSPVGATSLSDSLAEAGAFRLSDGTKINTPGALLPGVTVSQFDVYLYALDIAMKYRGWSLNSEAYYRTIQDIQGSAGEQISSFDDKGLYADMGYFLYESTLEAVLRYSVIDGALGSSTEYATGLNYYINGTHKNKLTFDVAYLDDSAVSSSGPNYFVGANGWLYRSQWQIAF